MTETKEPLLIYLLEGIFLVLLIAVIGSVAYHLIAQPTPSEIRKQKTVPNIIEAQTLKVVRKSDSMRVNVQKTDMFEHGTWSNDDHLFVSNVSANDLLAFAMPIPEESKYKIVVYLSRSHDYGEWAIKINNIFTKKVDLFSMIVEPTDPIQLGTHHLTPSDNILLFEVVGHNSKARPPYYQLGIDGVVIRRMNETP